MVAVVDAVVCACDDVGGTVCVGVEELNDAADVVSETDNVSHMTVKQTMLRYIRNNHVTYSAPHITN